MIKTFYFYPSLCASRWALLTIQTTNLMFSFFSLRAFLGACLFLFCYSGFAHAQLIFESKPGFYVAFDQLPYRGGIMHRGYGGTVGYRFSTGRALELTLSQDRYHWDVEDGYTYASGFAQIEYTRLKPIQDTKWHIRSQVSVRGAMDQMDAVKDGYADQQRYQVKSSFAILRTFDISKKVQGFVGAGAYLTLMQQQQTGNLFKGGETFQMGLEVPFGISFPLLKHRASLVNSLVSYHIAPLARPQFGHMLVLGKTKFSFNF